MKIFLQLFLYSLFTAMSAYSQDLKPYTITNVEQANQKIVITYDHLPVGDESDAEYQVEIRILRESEKNFSYELKNVSGSVGDGKFVGRGLKITWAYKSQFPKGIPYDDITFELTITKNEGIGNWVWYVGGAAVLGAGAAVLIKPKTTDDANATLPGPPTGRPF